MAPLSLLLTAALKVGIQRDIASLGTWEDRDRLLLVAKRGRISFRVLLSEFMLLGQVEVRDHLPPIDPKVALTLRLQPLKEPLQDETIAPSELRRLRAEILAVTRAATMPVPVKELAGRLVVPE